MICSECKDHHAPGEPCSMPARQLKGDEILELMCGDLTIHIPKTTEPTSGHAAPPLTFETLCEVHKELFKSAQYESQIQFHPDAVRDVRAILRQWVDDLPQPQQNMCAAQLLRMNDGQVMALFASLL